MVSRFSQGCRGFTLIELCVVIIVSGLIVASGFNAYRLYLKDKGAHESYDKLRTVESSLKLYSSFSQKLPCPSNPTIPNFDAASGLEISAATCAILRAAAPGTCQEGVCVAQGRDADNDGTPDKILIGGIPYSAIRSGSDPTTTTYSAVSNQQILDPWGYQMSYAVSARLTDNSLPFNSSFGAVDIVTEAGIALVDPPGSALYALIAHGDNHMGAYTAEGVLAIPCGAVGTTADAENCNNDGTFVAGLRSLGANADYYDDTVLHSAFTLSILWDFVGTTDDIYNRNPGNVGLGTSTPTQKLEVGNSTLGVHYNVSATTVSQAEICSKTSIAAGCWSPDFLAAPAGSGYEMTCPNTGTAGMVDIVIGVELDGAVPPKPKAKCGLVPMVAPSADQTCTVAGEYVLGFSSTGLIQCGPPP